MEQNEKKAFANKKLNIALAVVGVVIVVAFVGLYIWASI